MTSQSPAFVQGTRLRATLIDACGAPIGGACAQIVTKGFISVAMSDNIESPDEFKQKNAGGTYCYYSRSEPLLNYIGVKVALCSVNPELFSFLTGAPIVYDDNTPAQAIGWGTDTDSYASASIALEVWTNLAKVRGARACSASGRPQYGYLLLPWLIEGTIEDVTIENGPMNFTIDTITQEGNDWGVGPYDVLVDRLGSPSPLFDAIPSTRHRELIVTELAPPDVTEGCTSLVVPS
jgi:hypothetical protein